MPDVVADKYEIKGVLGEGGTGIVYDAIRSSDGAAVALKVMHAALAGDKQIRGRFQREAAILRRLEGPQICPILELGEVPGEEPGTTLLYIALPKLEGSSLERLLEREKPIALDRALDIMTEVCAALTSAHEQGVIHRDLKPANVIVEENGTVIVVDFGMSKIVTGGGMGTTNLTTHNMVFGTPEYMSPEQARGDELDARCDVYAAGIMLYEMATGAPPFTGMTPLNVLTAHLTADIESPRRRAGAARVSPALDTVILHALARERDARYPSASALAGALKLARLAPNETGSLVPALFSTATSGPEVFAATIPSLQPPPVESGSAPSPRVIVNDDRASDRPPSKQPPARPASVVPASAVPATKPSPSVDPSLGAALGKGRSPADAVSFARVSGSAPASGSSRGWIALWVLVAFASVGVGVWFALR